MEILEIPVTNFIKSCLSCNYLEEKSSLQVVVTKKKQCVVKFKEFIIFCCEIPVDTVKEMKADRFHDDCVIIIKSPTCRSCIVSLHKKKMVDSWENVYDIIIDDYMNVGHDQVVVVFNGTPSEFVVTDYECCNIDTHQKNVKENENEKDTLEAEPGYTSASKAIAKKLSKSMIAVNDLRNRNEEKKKFIESCCVNMRNQSIGLNNIMSHDCFLVDMLDERQSSFNISNQKIKKNPKCFSVLEIWKTPHAEHLLVYIKLQSHLVKEICDISLSAIGDFDLSCSSTIHFVKKTDKTVTECLEKNFKLPKILADSYIKENDVIALGVTIKLPLMKKHAKKFVLRADYKVVEDDCYQSSIIGSLDITSADILSDQTKLDLLSIENEKSTVYYESLFFQSTFYLLSQLSSLKNFPNVFSKRIGCILKTHSNVSVLLLKTIPGEIRFNATQSSCLCTIYVSKREHFAVVLQEIKDILPGDVQFGLLLKNKSVMGLFDQIHAEILNQIQSFDRQLAFFNSVDECDVEPNTVFIDVPRTSKKRLRSPADDDMVQNRQHNTSLITDQYVLECLQNCSLGS